MFGWLAVAALLGAQTDEKMAWPVADGFVIGHHQETAQGSIEEQVPKGETVEQWTRMLTRITLPATVDPTDYANHMAGMWRQGCPGATAGAPAAGARGTDIRIDCPLNPGTGKPETMFQRTVAGNGRLYVLQVAFRSVPTAQQAAWAIAQLDRAVLCHAGSKETACR